MGEMYEEILVAQNNVAKGLLQQMIAEMNECFADKDFETVNEFKKYIESFLIELN